MAHPWKHEGSSEPRLIVADRFDVHEVASKALGLDDDNIPAPYRKVLETRLSKVMLALLEAHVLGQKTGTTEYVNVYPSAW